MEQFIDQISGFIPRSILVLAIAVWLVLRYGPVAVGAAYD